MKFGRQVTFEVATLRWRKRFRSFHAANSLFQEYSGGIWLEEWHGNKLVRTVRR